MTTPTRNRKTGGSRESSPLALSVTYLQADGQRRTAVIAVDVNNLWTVYDIPADDVRVRTGLVVERLTGGEERLDAAIPLLIEYIAGQVAFRDGERENHSPADPLPVNRDRVDHPERVRLAAIRRDAKRARKAVEVDRERGSTPENQAWLDRVVELAEQQQRALETETEADAQPLAA